MILKLNIILTQKNHIRSAGIKPTPQKHSNTDYCQVMPTRNRTWIAGLQAPSQFNGQLLAFFFMKEPPDFHGPAV